MNCIVEWERERGVHRCSSEWQQQQRIWMNLLILDKMIVKCRTIAHCGGVSLEEYWLRRVGVIHSIFTFSHTINYLSSHSLDLFIPRELRSSRSSSHGDNNKWQCISLQLCSDLINYCSINDFSFWASKNDQRQVSFLISFSPLSLFFRKAMHALPHRSCHLNVRGVIGGEYL